MPPGRLARHRQPASRQRGFTYLGVLFLVTLLGLGLAGTFQVWSTSVQRSREQELIWVGTQYARAIQAYYAQSPGTRQYPLKLEELVEDKRFPATRRHLRKLYNDPITRSDDWGIIKTQDNRIAGIYSKSEAEPRKKARFPLRWDDFTDKKKYSEWRFVADLGLLGDARPGSGATDPLASPNQPTPIQPTPVQPTPVQQPIPQAFRRR